ncbi:hypothetical protein VRU48_09675 [Pedobacter sp. KR3-3]|uniref:Lipoprotein n=1 Tax=Pedobacter albus TaxID=3113905 RepID=A0ABU7I7C7_9SPHI|nr:hypothetical protein [Pedobacter sp. KR3-3]MEE1945377.1 hypothetical protein [Pedobacter sp. KR3-3]
MNKNIFTIALIAFLSLGIISSCNKISEIDNAKNEEARTIASLKLEKGDPNIKLSEAKSLEILKSKEAKELISAQNEFLDKVKAAVKSGKTLQELKDAITLEMSDPRSEAFTKIVFGDKDKWETYLKRLSSARLAYLKANEIFRLNTSSFTCSNCNVSEKEQVNNFFRNFNAYYDGKLQVIENNTSVPSANKTSTLKPNSVSVADDSDSDPNGDPTCGSYWQQAKLLACMTACSFSTVGVGTPLCGWACWCMLCSKNSATADFIC